MKTSWIIAGLSAAAAAVALFMASSAQAIAMPVCREDYRAVHHGGTRDVSRLRLIVIHSTEGPSALSAAGWFANKASGGSTHLVVDDVDCFRTLPDDVVPWGAEGDRANEDGLHIEMAGFAAWSRDEWLSHRETIRKTAAALQAWSQVYGIPLVFLSADDLRAQGDSARGVTTHANVTKAFGIVGGHTDPGVGFPIDVLMSTAGGRVPRMVS